MAEIGHQVISFLYSVHFRGPNFLPVTIYDRTGTDFVNCAEFISLNMSNSNVPSTTITIGRNTPSPLTVSRLGYGTMRLTGPHIWGEPEDRPQALAILKKA